MFTWHGKESCLSPDLLIPAGASAWVGLYHPAQLCCRQENWKGKNEMLLKTKSIYDPIEKSDGIRILVMTLWPRGFKKGGFDRWEKSLGTPIELIRKYKAGKIEWSQLKREYIKAMSGQKALLTEIAQLGKKQTVTLLCACREETTCHRSILKEMIERS